MISCMANICYPSVYQVSPHGVNYTDIVILDILLPEKEGADVLKEIREDEEWGKDVPIILLTNLEPSDYILVAIQKYKPSYYFIKSDIEPKEVLSKAKELLNI